MGPDNSENQEQAPKQSSYEERANQLMIEAFNLLKLSEQKSRENSLALTNIEQAMMWNNKDRTIKGQLQPYPGTHVQAA